MLFHPFEFRGIRKRTVTYVNRNDFLFVGGYRGDGEEFDGIEAARGKRRWRWGGTGISGEGNVKGVQANLSAPDTPTSRDDEVDRTRRCVPTRENFSPRATTLNLVYLLPAPERAEWLLQETSRPAAWKFHGPGLSCPDTSSSLNWSRAIDRFKFVWVRVSLSKISQRNAIIFLFSSLPFASPKCRRDPLTWLRFRAFRRLRNSLEKLAERRTIFLA